jgi:hypothetical protein
MTVSPNGPKTSPSNGRALVVGQPAFRSGPLASLERQGYVCTEVDDPYQAMIQLCRRPLFYSAIVVSLNSFYREELAMIGSIKQRFSHIDIWLSDTDGRQAALAEAMRLGADGLFADDGMYRIANGSNTQAGVASQSDSAIETGNTMQPFMAAPERAIAEKSGDPLLTAEELRALLQDSPNSM